MSIRVGKVKRCTECGKSFPPRSNVQKFCDKCASKREEVRKNTKKCPVCSTLFYASKMKGGRRMTCSRTCANRINGSKSNAKDRNFGEAKCEACGKYFTIRAKNQKYCNIVCRKKVEYQRNIESHKRRNRIKVTRLKIGLNIRDETLKTPSKDAKWLWDGIGRWSVKFWPDIQKCLECNTNVYRHMGNGLCARCYDKLRPTDPEKMKEWKKKAYERAKAVGKMPSAKQARMWIKKAKSGDIPITPKIENLLHNLENI